MAVFNTVQSFPNNARCHHETIFSLWGLQASVGAVLAASMMVTSPMAYAAPFDTGTGMAPTGELHVCSCHACKGPGLGPAPP